LRKVVQNYPKKINKQKNLRNIAYIALGSNKGDRIGYLRNACAELSDSSKVIIIKSSSVYETKPFGKVDQADFLNAVIKIKTTYKLAGLFNCLKKLEIKLGRKGISKWGPREIDLDLLFFNDRVFNTEKLTVPHYGIQDRDFVLMPLNEIAKGYFHPALKKKISDICTDDISKNVIRKTRYKII
jgi:2-amino-4-hydroxy-6-hydroxymethyldihydropteridine diphosphokinase